MRRTKVTFDNDKLQVSTEIMRALAHPLRLRILEFIDRNGKINVNKIYNTLNLEQSITSQHLKVLRLAGVVKQQKQGKYVLYSIEYDLVDRASRAVNRFLGKN
ncbi:MAG: helix-turn-helix transcriptional regulator [Saprospiraceae bacterium]|nr:helix-turn-helix transcriptional regulator [Saprospiraceae bacterium]